MKTFKIVDDDIVFDSINNIEMVEDEEEIMQCVQRTLSTNLKEWFLNEAFGLDYAAIQTKQVDKDNIRIALLEAIFQESRVEEVTEINIEFNHKERNILISFKFRTANGEQEGEVIV